MLNRCGVSAVDYSLDEYMFSSFFFVFTLNTRSGMYLIFKSKGGMTINSRKDLPFSAFLVSFQWPEILFCCTRNMHVANNFGFAHFNDAVVGTVATLHLCPLCVCVYIARLSFSLDIRNAICLLFCARLFNIFLSVSFVHVSDWHNVCERWKCLCNIFFYSFFFIPFTHLFRLNTLQFFGKDFCPHHCMPF